jgi:hypothetical protein
MPKVPEGFNRKNIEVNTMNCLIFTGCTVYPILGVPPVVHGESSLIWYEMVHDSKI